MSHKAKKTPYNQDENRPQNVSDIAQAEIAPKQADVISSVEAEEKGCSSDAVVQQSTPPSLEELAQRYEPEIKAAFAQSNEVLRQIQMKMASSALMEVIPIEQRTQMSRRDLFLIGLSFLRTADILWMSGLMPEEDYKRYNCFENKKLRFNHQQITSRASITLLDCDKESRVGLSLPLPIPSFEEIQEYALEQGYVFNVAPESVLEANQLKKSAQLCEMLLTNVRGVFLDTQDGLPQTDWHVPNDELTSEYICLKSMILLRNGYEHDGSEVLDSLLYTLTVNRVQCDVINMADYIEKSMPTNEALLTTMPYVRQLFEQVQDSAVLETNARQAFLYHAIKETEKCLEMTSPDYPEWGQWLSNWMKNRTQNVIKNMPQEIIKTKLQRGLDEGNQRD